MYVAKHFHILIIPGSWPSRRSPLSGIYIKDFVDTLEENSENFHFSILYTGNNEYGVSFSEPFSFLKAIYRRFVDRKTIFSRKVTLYIRPILYFYKFGREYYENKKLKSSLRVLSDLQKSCGPINLIHAHLSHSAGSIAKNISQILAVPYIITEHAGPFPFDAQLIKDNKLSEGYFEILKKAQCIIAVSHSLKNRIQSFGLKNVIYIPNPVNEKKFFVSKREKNNINMFVFLAVGSLTYMKGIDILLKSFSELIKKYPEKNFFLRIVGDGPEFHIFINLAKKLNIEYYTSFLGEISPDYIGEFYREADCLVHASRHESFGLVCAEAQASGLPVIATKCGGPESIILSSSLGILVENEHPELLAAAMYDVYKNYNTYRSNEIRNHFIKNFSRKIVSKKLLDVYLEYAKY